MQSFWDRCKDVGVVVTLAVVATVIAIVATVQTSWGADKNGEGYGILGPLTAPQSSTPWTGIGIGAYGSYVNADVDIPGYPATIGSTGYTAGGVLDACMQAGSFVACGFGEYGWVFGDLNDIGVDNEYALGGKAGFLINPQTLLYGVAAKSWVEASGETFEGWAFGGGAAVKMPSSPLFLSLEYRRSTYDVFGTDVDADTVRLGLSYKLGGK